MSDDEPIGMMTTEQCWDMLRTHEFGRLAYHLAGEVHLTPINYAVDHDTLLFRTAEGSKLLAVEMNPDVAFEIDEFDEHHARSVVVRGVGSSRWDALRLKSQPSARAGIERGHRGDLLSRECRDLEVRRKEAVLHDDYPRASGKFVRAFAAPPNDPHRDPVTPAGDQDLARGNGRPSPIEQHGERIGTTACPNSTHLELRLGRRESGDGGETVHDTRV